MIKENYENLLRATDHDRVQIHKADKCLFLLIKMRLDFFVKRGIN